MRVFLQPRFFTVDWLGVGSTSRGVKVDWRGGVIGRGMWERRSAGFIVVVLIVGRVSFGVRSRLLRCVVAG